MKYGQYIVKKRMRVDGINGRVNIPWGTILPVAAMPPMGDFIMHQGRALCGVGSENQKTYFWGYDPADPQAEIKRQETAAALLAISPKDDAGALSSPFSPWRKYGHLEETPVGAMWVWDDAVEDMPQPQLDHLLECARSGATPTEVPT